MRKNEVEAVSEYECGERNPWKHSILFDVYHKMEPAVKSTADMLSPLINPCGKRDKDTLKTGLHNLYRAWQLSKRFRKDIYVALSMRKENYRGTSRYALCHISYVRVRRVVETLEEQGYIRRKPGIYYDNPGGKKVTRIIATPKLEELFEAGEYTSSRVRPIYPVLVRDSAGRYCPPPNKETHRRMCRKSHRINDEIQNNHTITISVDIIHEYLDSVRNWYEECSTEPFEFRCNELDSYSYIYDTLTHYSHTSNTYLYPYTSIPTTTTTPYTITGPFSYKDLHKCRIIMNLLDGKPVSDNQVDITDAVYLMRIFNDSSLVLGGRFYSDVQNLPKNPYRFRSYLLIDGEPTVELDYSGMHIRMLYARLGTPYEEDPYSVQGFDRDIMKLASLVAINADDRTDALKPLCREGIKNPGRILDAFEDHHRHIEEYFYTGVGKHLQYVDSCIAGKVMRRFTKRGKAVIPVHDSFIVPESLEDELRDGMNEAYEEFVGFSPVIEKKEVNV